MEGASKFYVYFVSLAWALSGSGLYRWWAQQQGFRYKWKWKSWYFLAAACASEWTFGEQSLRRGCE